MAITINPLLSPRIITVPEVDGDSITIQSLVNQIRDWEDEQVNLCYDKILLASGKEDLGGSIYVGITATMENAKLKFADRGSPTICKVFGGNLVAVDEYGDAMYVIEPSVNVTVILAQSSSATIIVDAAEWSQGEKDDIFDDINHIDISLEEVKDHSTEFDPTKESLKAIRKKLDEGFTKKASFRG